MLYYLEKKGYKFSALTIHKYMITEMHLNSIARPKYHNGYGKAHKIFENKLNQDFTASKPNQKWCTDLITFS